MSGSAKAQPAEAEPGDEIRDAAALASTEGEDELARLAKALGHPARVRILRILAAKHSCICGELVEALPLAQSTVSQHLKVLKEAGFIRGEIEGPRICYCLEPKALRRLRVLIADL